VRLAAVALALGLLGGACAATGYQYVKSSEDNTYFRIPDDWKLYDEEAVLDLLVEDAPESTRENLRDVSWQVGFDAHAKPSIEHAFRPRSSPGGNATVQTLTSQQSDAVSIAALRNFLVDIDALEQEGQGAILSESRIERDGGFFGVHVIGVFTVNQRGRQVTYNQITLLDQAGTKVYSLFVACDTDCYEANERDIDRVIASWTVEE
jgi:hypothetical protein